MNFIIIIDINRVSKITGLSKSTLLRLEKNGDFPKRKKLSPRRIGWVSTDIKEWINSSSIELKGETYEN